MIRMTSHKLLALSRLMPDAEAFRESPPAAPVVWSMPAASITPLLSLEDADLMLKSGAVRVDMVEVVRDGDLLAKSEYGIDSDDPSSRVATDRLHTLVRGGATVILNCLQECSPALEEICGRISFELGVDVAANAYLTPSGSQGFQHHYDLHSVLIVQTSGSKTWSLYPPVVVDPIGEQRLGGRLPQSFWDRDVKEKPYLETTLNPGDVLWIPRGWIHSGRATDDHSLHLTLGLEPLTPYWLVGQILTRLADVAELRGDLPWGVANSPESLQRAAEKAIGDLAAAVAEIDWSAFAETMIRQRKRRELRKRDLPLLAADISPETSVVTNRSVIYGVSVTPEGGLKIQMARTSVTIHDSKIGDLDGLLRREEDEPWSALDLVPQLDSGTAVRIVEKLVHHGVVRLF